MESRNRNLWIILAVIAVLLCFCVLIVAIVIAAGAGLFATMPVFQEVGIGRVTERSEQAYPVGQAPMLTVDNFAGNITVRSGESGRIRVLVTKRAPTSSDLDRVNVDLSRTDNGLRIRTSRPGSPLSNISVEFEIYVPADARLDLDTGAGNVETDDVEGEILVHTGAGNVQVWGAAGTVALDTGAGNIDYEGEPRGRCTFDTGAGNITLGLPADANVEIDLQTGIGNISLGGFDVRGDTSGPDVSGTIGTGAQASIEAQSGVGNISLTRR